MKFCKLSCYFVVFLLQFIFLQVGISEPPLPMVEGQGIVCPLECPDKPEDCKPTKCPEPPTKECPTCPKCPYCPECPDDPPWNCDLFQMEVARTGKYGQADNIINYKSALSEVPCLKNVVNKVVDICTNKNAGAQGTGYDDCIAKRMEERFGLDPETKLQEEGSRYFYFDDKCQTVINPDGFEDKLYTPCDALIVNYFGTPISFIWEEGFDIEEQAKVVHFDLDPAQKAEWFLWKASAKAPLLVFDPERKGKIKSAHQLFGSWTFGGKRVASLNSKASAVAWQNGYEALGSLDQNQDGKISGSELEVLSLWFDNNQDAVSQPGEVKTLAELNVQVVYYNPDYKDPVTGNIFASKGFEVLRNAKSITGKSVDWYAEGHESQAKLLHKLMLREVFKTSSKMQATNPAVSPSDTLSLPVSLNNLVGVWKWSNRNEDLANKIGGYFVFSKAKDGSIQGRSIFQVGLPNRHAGDVMVSSVPLQVKSLFSSGTSHTVELILDAGGGRALTKSIVQLDQKQNYLKGTSTMHVREQSRWKLVNYDWVAKKL